MNNQNSHFYSVVIPVYNEKENIAPLIEEIEPVMANLGKQWELIVVDDGSKDGTWHFLQQLKPAKPYLKPIRLIHNSGQTAALSAGFKHAQGYWVITLDGDGQNDPKDIPKLLEKAGLYDLVCGIRRCRKDSLLKKSISFVANIGRQLLLQDGVRDTGCSLKVYRKSCLSQIKLYQGMHRFFPALFQIEGFTVTTIPVSHRPRQCGTSKYHLFNRFLRPVIDLLAIVWMRRRRLNYEIYREK